MWFNRSLVDFRVPAGWKLATITSLFEKGERTHPGNYRPVALLPIIFNVVDCVLNDLIGRYLFKQPLMSLHQHGFVRGSVGYVAQKIRSTSAYWSPTCPIFKFKWFRFKIKKDDLLLEKKRESFFFYYVKSQWSNVHTNFCNQGNPLAWSWNLDWASQWKPARECRYIYSTYSSSRQ